MFQTGIVSITFRHLLPAQIVKLVSQAGLDAIEWGGDVHVPHGDTKVAREVLAHTQEANLDVAAYGSYYRIGHSEDEGLSFRHVLHTAIELDAPVIRVWAGRKNSGDADEAYRRLIVNESRHICELASEVGVLVALEFHGGTLTDTAESARQLLEEVNHPNLRTLWQQRVGANTSDAKADLEMLLPWLAHMHVFRWEGSERRPLAEGDGAWREFFALAAVESKPSAALIEFVRNDSPEQFLDDARALKRWAAATAVSPKA